MAHGARPRLAGRRRGGADFGGAELRFRYGLAGGDSPGRVAALVFDTPRGTAPNDRLTFTIRAERPMRISVQLRMGDDQGEASRERWQRSVYVDTADQERTIYFDDLMPVGETHTSRPVFPAIRSMLFVVDTTNTKPGDSGRIWIKARSCSDSKTSIQPSKAELWPRHYNDVQQARIRC